MESVTRIFLYNSKIPLHSLGECRTRVKVKNEYFECKFQVVASNSGCVLGNESLVHMRIVRFMNTVEVIEDSADESFESSFAKQYPNLFSDRIGKFNKFQVKLTIDRSVKLVHQKARNVPLHLREKVETALQKLLDDDIIEKVVGPTTWVSPIVPVPKPNGEIRICVDSRLANKAISREAHSIKTVEDVAIKLNNAKIFSKLYLRSGYNQIELDPDSRDIVGYGEDENKHDVTLHLILKALQDAGFTLNVRKCVFKKSEMVFFGIDFSAEGIKLIEETCSLGVDSGTRVSIR